MFLGMDLPALNLPDPWDTYTMIGFVSWHVGIDVLLEIHGYCLIRKGRAKTGAHVRTYAIVTTSTRPFCCFWLLKKLYIHMLSAVTLA